ncbi:glycosyltransferase [Mycetocola tolaasinivorans]|uniref:Glycosyltransferase n=1 Tax=Mycetocola tolaasinivorans TaxID=76635 RepID=A0A3L7AC70_9MICO|nr:WecB/TagA/CpsF family glycosyltransferase [Mycetocola tolaasinivorans]RLP77817.1 glycosyltransferase [Mycetocola tolaasinivorans]
MSTIQMSFVENRSLLGGHELFSGGTDDLLEELDEMVRENRRHLVITPNVDQALLLSRDDSLQYVFERASMRLIDGFPLMALARFLGDGEAQRHTGADLLEITAAESVRRGWRIAITGGAESTTAAAARNLAAQYPGAEIVAVPFPQIGEDVHSAESAQVVSALAEFEPDLVFLCLGFPKQERWYLTWEDALPPAVYIGSGAAVEFAAGSRVRAPQLVQRAGLEWMWRLLQEPGRLAHRYLIRGPRFLGLLLRSLRMR